MSFHTISELFYRTVKDNAQKNLFYHKKDGNWQGISGNEVLTTVRNISFGLHALGINGKRNVSILSNNSPWWAMTDYGIICSGCASVSIYPTLIAKQIEYIINDSESVAVFVENQEQLDKMTEIHSDCPKCKYTIVLDNSYTGTDENIMNLSRFLALGEEYGKKTGNKFEDLVKTVKPDDLLTLIYTSGTTGNPKGVMLSHHNMVSNVKGTIEKIDFFNSDVFLSYLPLSHSFERMGGHFTAFHKGSTVYYAESIELLPQNMTEVRPTVMLSVPRLYEKMHAKVIENVKAGSPLKRKIFWWSIEQGKKVINYKLNKEAVPSILSFKYNIAKKLVFNKIKEKIGGRLRYFVSGGAPLSQEIAEFFAAADILILEGYGLTETSPVLTVNTPEEVRFGTVGKPLNNVKVKIADDGEIVVKGPNIMMGYYKNQKATDEVLDKDGWFYTGDIGVIDKDGFLKITDRKKNLIVTSGGKNIAPAPLENALLSSTYIEQVVVIGDKRNFISALIVPNFEYVGKYLDEKGISISDAEAVIEHEAVLNLFNDVVKKAMENFSNYERVKKFALIPRLFTIERGEITPSLKIVRRIVMTNYDEIVEGIYSGGKE